MQTRKADFPPASDPNFGQTHRVVFPITKLRPSNHAITQVLLVLRQRSPTIRSHAVRERPVAA